MSTSWLRSVDVTSYTWLPDMNSAEPFVRHAVRERVVVGVAHAQRRPGRPELLRRTRLATTLRSGSPKRCIGRSPACPNVSSVPPCLDERLQRLDAVGPEAAAVFRRRGALRGRRHRPRPPPPPRAPAGGSLAGHRRERVGRQHDHVELRRAGPPSFRSASRTVVNGTSNCSNMQPRPALVHVAAAVALDTCRCAASPESWSPVVTGAASGGEIGTPVARQRSPATSPGADEEVARRTLPSADAAVRAARAMPFVEQEQLTAR